MTYYIVGIDFGDGETSANHIDIENDRQEIFISRIKGNPGKITSSICKGVNNEWIISPTPDHIQNGMQDENVFEYNDCFKNPLAVFLQSVYRKFFREYPNTLDITGIRDFFTKLNSWDDQDGGDNGAEELGYLRQNIHEEQEGNHNTVRHFIKFAKRVYANIINQNNLTTDPCNFSLYAACPSSWANDGNNLKQIYKIFLNAIGIPCEEVIEESRAAFMNCRNFARQENITPQLPGLLVIDFGSSTIDFTWYQGDRFYHNGKELGAHIVEKALFYYMIGHESVARNTFINAAELFPNEIVLQRIIFLALRKLKEEFYNLIAAGEENPLLGEVRLADYAFAIANAAIEDPTLVTFGFDEEPGTHFPRRYNQETINQILNSEETDFYSQNIPRVYDCIPPECCEYESKIITAFEECKEQVTNMNGRIDYVILTGGASVMSFIKPDIEQVFGVSYQNKTLFWDPDASYAVSKGIVQYGVFHHKSKPIIEKIENILRERWLSENFLNELLNTKVLDIVHKLYRDNMVEVLTEWYNGTVGMSLQNTLNGYFKDIIENDGQNDQWRMIREGIKAPLVEGCKSLHALYRRVFDFIDKNPNIGTICTQLNQELAQEIHQEVGELYQQYWEIYFPQDTYQNIIQIDIQPDINISFTPEYKLHLLKALVERADEQIGYLTWRSLNKHRHQIFDLTGPARLDFQRSLTPVLISFANEINPTFNRHQAVLKCHNQIKESFQNLQRRCTLATHDINNNIFDL